MVWWVYAGIAAAQLASSYMGGQSKAAAAERSATAAYNASLWNAHQTQQIGMFNALTVGSSGRINAAQQLIAGKIQADSLKEIALYNAELTAAATTYNTSLLMDQLPQLMAERDLQFTHIRQTAARQEGSLIAYQAASGTVIGEGSNLDVLVDNRTQAELDMVAVGLNYEWKMDAIYDAIAKNQWEGEQAIKKGLYEAEMQARNIKNQSAFNAFATLSNTLLQQFSILNNSLATAASQERQGPAAYTTGMSQADAARTSGLIGGLGQGSSTLLGGWGSGAFGGSPTATSAASGSSNIQIPTGGNAWPNLLNQQTDFSSLLSSGFGS